jgi:hypothetical protein
MLIRDFVINRFAYPKDSEMAALCAQKFLAFCLENCKLRSSFWTKTEPEPAGLAIQTHERMCVAGGIYTPPVISQIVSTFQVMSTLRVRRLLPRASFDAIAPLYSFRPAGQCSQGISK